MDFQPKGFESVVSCVEPLPVPKRYVLRVDVHPVIERLVDNMCHDQPPSLRRRGISAGALRPNSRRGSDWNTDPSRSNHHVPLNSKSGQP